MQSSIVKTIDDLAAWRAALDRGAAGFARFLNDHELVDEPDLAVLTALRAAPVRREARARLRGRVLARQVRADQRDLLRRRRSSRAAGHARPHDDVPGRAVLRCRAAVPAVAAADRNPAARAVAVRTARQRRRLAARAAGPEEPGCAGERARGRSRAPVASASPTPPRSASGATTTPTRTRRSKPTATVEVPAWRHALINYPHPLLQRGLVVLDTPGLNAIGAEPELTLSLLPSAHATVFVLAADTGVTRSDLAIWREHLGGDSVERFVVLNKIDTLVDPLASPAEVAAQIERQRELTAQTLALPRSRVFPLSARNALAARVGGDAAALAASRLPELEDALSAELLPRQHELLVLAAASTVQRLRSAAGRRLADRRRQQAEQLLELRGLRGKSGAKLRLMLQRIDAEMQDFERCTARLSAVRSVQARLLRAALARLSSDALRAEVAAMQAAAGAGPLKLGARQAFGTLCDRLRGALTQAAGQAGEMRQMLDASFLQLNAEFGFAFTLSLPPELDRFTAELDLIDRNYSRYLSLSQAWRLVTPGFAEQFRRMLLSKLRVVFESAAGELEMWSKTASGQIDVQLRERRRGFKRRREALERIQVAAGELERASPRSNRRTATWSNSNASSCALPTRCCRWRAACSTTAPSRCPTRACARLPPDDRRGYGPARRALAAPARPPRTALAGNARRLPHLAVRSDAAADAGQHRARLLRALPRALPRRALARRRAAGRRARAVERPGLLQPRAQPAPLCAGGRGRAWWALSAQRRGARPAARHRPLDGGGDRRLRLRRARRDPGRQRQARADARARLRRRPGARRRGARAVAGRDRAAAGARHRGLHPGADGPRCRRLPDAAPAVRAVPAGRTLRRACRGRARALPGEDAQAQARPAPPRAAVAGAGRLALPHPASGAGRLGRPVEPARVRPGRRAGHPHRRLAGAGRVAADDRACADPFRLDARSRCAGRCRGRRGPRSRRRCRPVAGSRATRRWRWAWPRRCGGCSRPAERGAYPITTLRSRRKPSTSDSRITGSSSSISFCLAASEIGSSSAQRFATQPASSSR